MICQGNMTAGAHVVEADQEADTIKAHAPRMDEPVCSQR